jgi:peptidoglycan/LPS O-acetylase OafA/YrhL
MQSAGKNTPSSAHGIAYRPEIDGLRALAVLPVLFFHAGYNLFSGGYVGVDIFFVISGYLITAIIYKDLAAGQFSIAKFYERRARRILPALFVVIACTLPFAWFLMMPAQIEDFAKSILGVIAFCSNIYFWITLDYFDDSAEFKPMLHTWSLGVEEQYYILFPLFLLAMFRFGLKKSFWAVAILFAVSLATALLKSDDPDVNFFFTPSRAWELMAGALCALLTRGASLEERFSVQKRQGLSLLGLLLIFVAIFGFEANTPSPSQYTLFPVLGAALVILFAGRDNIAGKILSRKFPVFVGLLSYSAYLWHQPVFAFVRLYKEDDFSYLVGLVLIIICFGLAYLSWRYVERPFRDMNFLSRRKVFMLSLAGSLFFAGLGVLTLVKDGFIERYPVAERAFVPYYDKATNGDYVRTYFNSIRDDFGDNPLPNLLIIGDSFAQDFSNMVFENRRLKNYEVRSFYVPARCQIYLGDEPRENFIDAQDKELCDKEDYDLEGHMHIVAEADVVILVASWRMWSAERLQETIKRMKLRDDQKLVVIGRKSFGKIRLKELSKIPLENRPAMRNSVKGDQERVNAYMRRTVPKKSFVDLQQTVCGAQDTCIVFTPEGGLLSHDGNHITKEGAAYLGSLLFDKNPILKSLDAN